MGVYINGFPLPNNCGACPLRLAWCRERIYILNRPDRCPLVHVPPHGDLIEKNAVFELIRSFPNVDRQLPVEFMKALYELPTILEAEEGET